ncbi:hypothetical protein [Agriterribacter sp.]|uniref:hypothetical protein n=1 Tax=Agriterribacter sp. TaxID=2821509 RepID=UPI002CBFE0A7|nr:hypothetical protein [Agriterribacter sp.]HRO47903.1 hypothetical protein [Agriterribacter sp.]HRQ15932.1 hypothetical protein [Agriterribacter sp.]
MKKLKLAALTAFISIMAIHIQAQTVDELQTSYIKALGGKETLSSLKNIFVEVNMEVMGMQMPAKQWIIYGIASRQEVAFQGQKMITFIAKDKGWMINPLMGSTEARPIPDDAIKAAEGTLIAGSELTDYKTRGFTAVYEGKDTVNNIAAHKIILSRENYESTFYLDPNSYYVIRNVVKTEVDQQPVTQTTDFSDYRKTPEGFVFAYNTIISNAMVGEIRSSISKIEINTSLDIKALEQTN